MTVSMKIVMECARKLDEARTMKLELRDKSDVEISTPEILAMGDVAFRGSASRVRRIIRARVEAE